MWSKVPKAPSVYTADNVIFTLEIEPEQCEPVEGNVLCSEDEAADKEAEEWVKSELARGNELAWCCLTVTAMPKHLEAVRAIEDHAIDSNAFRAGASLGCCSYPEGTKIEEQVEYSDLKFEALAALNAKARFFRAHF